MIIGVTGTKASGKGVVAEILQKKGFVYSLDFVGKRRIDDCNIIFGSLVEIAKIK